MSVEQVSTIVWVETTRSSSRICPMLHRTNRCHVHRVTAPLFSSFSGVARTTWGNNSRVLGEASVPFSFWEFSIWALCLHYLPSLSSFQFLLCPSPFQNYGVFLQIWFLYANVFLSHVFVRIPRRNRTDRMNGCIYTQIHILEYIFYLFTRYFYSGL